jgi:hypothetical protein
MDFFVAQHRLQVELSNTRFGRCAAPVLSQVLGFGLGI